MHWAGWSSRRTEIGLRLLREVTVPRVCNTVRRGKCMVAFESDGLPFAAAGAEGKKRDWLPAYSADGRLASLGRRCEARPAAVRIDGRAIAEEIKRSLSAEVSCLKEEGAVPGVAILRVGHRKDSEIYVHGKRVACAEIGINSFVTSLPESASEAEILEEVQKFNDDSRVHGILVQLPLPNHIKAENVLKSVRLEKDVDGLHPANLRRLAEMSNSCPTFVPCTPLGCMEILARLGIDLEKKHAVVIGYSNTVGFPTAALLQRRKAKVTIVQVDTPNPTEATRKADILVAAAGVPHLVRGNWLKPGAVVIDVGITAQDDPEAESGFRVIGDVCFEEAERVASAITPVPGGVGPMTIAMLLANTLKAAQQSLNKARGYAAPFCSQ